jgi:hypothetical protein
MCAEPSTCRELRRTSGERPHSGPVIFIGAPADGQLAWTASPKGLLLWDATSGYFMGPLQRPKGAAAVGEAGGSEGSAHGVSVRME